MNAETNVPLVRALRAAGLLLAAAVAFGRPGPAAGHEGHDALPSTGATVEGNKILLSEGARKGIGLRTAKVTLEDLRRVLRVRARVELPWDGQALVTTLAAGRVEQVFVKPGETVTAGQELARVESLELESLQLEMLQAAEEADLARRLADQRRSLADKGIVAGKSLLEAESDLRQKQSRLDIARRKLDALGLSGDALDRIRETGEPVGYVSVTSPIDGVVMHVDLRGGESVRTTEHLFNIVDRSRVLLIGEALETDAWQVRPGMPVEATFTALPGRTFPGTIDRVRLEVDKSRRTLDVVVPVANPQGRLRPGASGRMAIQVHGAKEAVVCPADALIETATKTYVLLRQGEGKYERRAVEIGLRTREKVEVLDGLFPGDRVVVTGTKLLASMFHTDPRSTEQAMQASAPGQTRSRSASGEVTSSGRETPSSIRVAQGVIQLPTTRKSFATSAIAGRIAKIHVEPGEAVEAGRLLAELDSQELRSIQLELLETRAKRHWTRTTLERLRPLEKRGTVQRSELWRHETELKLLDHRLRGLARKLSLIGLSDEAIDAIVDAEPGEGDADMGFLMVPIRAPAAGVLADFEVVPGQIVGTDGALFEIQDSGRVWIEGYVFEQDASRVEVGEEARVTFPAYPELELTGTVVRSSPTLHPSSRVLSVWIEAPNPDRKLREGMLARVEIVERI